MDFGMDLVDFNWNRLWLKLKEWEKIKCLAT